MIASQDIVLTARNQHSPECGAAPNIMNSEAGKYYGYFENEYGEQWVLVYDRREQRGVLRGGDAEWEKEYEVVEGNVPLVLSPPERAWLHACLKAVGAR